MFEVRDEWNVTIRQFEDREDAMDFIRQRGEGRFWISEGE